MSYIFYALIIVVTGFIIMQAYVMLRMKKKRGSAIDIEKIPEEFREHFKRKKLLVYLFSPRCGACKTMEPVIDELQNETGNLVKIDISKNIDMARSLGILATPTTLLIKNDIIAEILIGIKTGKEIRNLFND